MNEAETRAEHIDPALRAAGWGVVEGSRIRREYAITAGRNTLATQAYNDFTSFAAFADDALVRVKP